VCDDVHVLPPVDAPLVPAVRGATPDDLPAVHGLIRESFAALLAHMPGQREALEAAAEGAIADGDISVARFEGEFLARRSAGFWVAEHKDDGVIGCIGLKPDGEDAELVRMAVASAARGQRIGSRLVAALVEFARAAGVAGVHLTTGNPDAARFYRREGFAVVSEFQIPDGPPELKVFRMRLALRDDAAERAVR